MLLLALVPCLVDPHGQELSLLHFHVFGSDVLHRSRLAFAPPLAALLEGEQVRIHRVAEGSQQAFGGVHLLGAHVDGDQAVDVVSVLACYGLESLHFGVGQQTSKYSVHTQHTSFAV